MLEVLGSIGRVISGLFNWRFDNFVVMDLIRIIYLLTVILGGLALVVSAFGTLFQPYVHFAAKLGMILGYIAAYIFSVLVARLGAEMAIILFRIESNTRKSRIE